MKIIFEENAKPNATVEKLVQEFLNLKGILEVAQEMPVVIFQDGMSGAYYIKCSILASDVVDLCDLNAKLDINNPEGFRANRELMLTNYTYLKMERDALKGREFNDVIVEYNTSYSREKPLKVWGGQHRVSAISKAGVQQHRFHGFRIYFNLSKEQRNEVALISNTNIAVSNDTFDRMVEETMFGDVLRIWCQHVGFLNTKEDFPDTGSRSEKITVKKARTFITNYYLGKQIGTNLETSDLDKRVYEPYLTETGTSLDPKYDEIMRSNNILDDAQLLEAGKRFLALHHAQVKAISEEKKRRNTKAYKNKAMVESVLCGWSFISGLLQSHPERLKKHYVIPKVSGRIHDPLNADEMSKYKHDSDKATYRGLGTRSALKDRQRMAQLFLARTTKDDNAQIDKDLMYSAVSQVVGLLSLSKGYSK